jgi:hypothetical protein
MRAYQERPIRYRVLRRVTSFGLSYLPLALSVAFALAAVLAVAVGGMTVLSMALAAGALVVALAAWWEARRWLRWVELSGDRMTLVFTARRVWIPLEEVREVFVAGEDLRDAIVEAAGRSGRRTPQLDALGMVDVFAVTHEALVVVRCEGRLPLVLGVEFPEEFVADVASFAPHVNSG